jgi:CarD family transcriptional regulator
LILPQKQDIVNVEIRDETWFTAPCRRVLVVICVNSGFGYCIIFVMNCFLRLVASKQALLAAALRENMARKSESSFEEGDFVVYPTHGVGRILGTEEREVAGMKLEMLVVRFEHDRMTLRVPMEKARSLGLRTLSSKKQMEQAITTLQGKAKVRRTMWSRRAQEYETKIKSGDPVSIAEVVRDLHRRTNQSEQSYSERQMYQAALERLAREFAAIEKIDQDAAALRLEDLMDAA